MDSIRVPLILIDSPHQGIFPNHTTPSIIPDIPKAIEVSIRLRVLYHAKASIERPVEPPTCSVPVTNKCIQRDNQGLWQLSCAVRKDLKNDNGFCGLRLCVSCARSGILSRAIRCRLVENWILLTIKSRSTGVRCVGADENEEFLVLLNANCSHPCESVVCESQTTVVAKPANRVCLIGSDNPSVCDHGKRDDRALA